MGRTVMPLVRQIAAAAILAGLLLATLGLASPAEARRDLAPIYLYGSRAAGWGLTNTSLTRPGPSLDVWVGDNVTLNLTSVDGRQHSWFIDYDNDSLRDANEPRSTFFGGASPTTIVWNFTVSNVTGTFRYRSDRGSDVSSMWGNITVSPAGTGDLLSNSTVIAGIVVLAVAVVAILVYFSRRRSKSVPPPPPPEG